MENELLWVMGVPLSVFGYGLAAILKLTFWLLTFHRHPKLVGGHSFL